MSKIIGLVFEDTEVYTCPVCGKEYKTEAALAKHAAKEHPETPPEQ